MMSDYVHSFVSQIFWHIAVMTAVVASKGSPESRLCPSGDFPALDYVLHPRPLAPATVAFRRLL